MDPIAFKVTVTKGDLLNLRRDRYEPLIAWFCFVGCLGVLLLLPGIVRFLLMGCVIALFLGYGVFRSLGLEKRRRFWSDIGETTYSFEEEGIRVNHSRGERFYAWPTLTMRREHKTAYLFYYMDLPRILIPKRCLGEKEGNSVTEFVTRMPSKRDWKEQKRAERRNATI